MIPGVLALRQKYIRHEITKTIIIQPETLDESIYTV